MTPDAMKRRSDHKQDTGFIEPRKARAKKAVQNSLESTTTVIA
jgi:hypothetical protein